MTTEQPAPRRVDPAALKALSHPLRVELLDRLSMFGPATASGLAEALGENSGATSYHLRQLARHGLIEEDTERGSARDKYWRVVRGGLQLDADGEPGSAEYEAKSMVVRQIVDQRARHLDAYVRHAEADLGREWVDAAIIQSAALTLTAAELAEVSKAMHAVVREMVGRYAERGDVDGARPVTIQVNAFPLMDPR